jgi:hypothetical protein
VGGIWGATAVEHDGVDAGELLDEHEPYADQQRLQRRALAERAEAGVPGAAVHLALRLLDEVLCDGGDVAGAELLEVGSDLGRRERGVRKAEGVGPAELWSQQTIPMPNRIGGRLLWGLERTIGSFGFLSASHFGDSGRKIGVSTTATEASTTTSQASSRHLPRTRPRM